MTILQILSVLLTIAAIAAYVNHRLLHMPRTIGLMSMTLALSFGLVVLGRFHVIDLSHATTFVHSIDFSASLLHGMLAFLLFAGALHININDIRKEAYTIALLSTLGVVLATFGTGWLVWMMASWWDVNIPFFYALLFGALISPTDPIAVLGVLKKIGVPKSLEAKIAGESLFNDGVGVVVFLLILGLATGGQEVSPRVITVTFMMETVGGLVLGLLLGWIVYRLLKSVDNYQLESLLTLALATGGYALAEALHISAPITIVVAGLFIGNHGRSLAMSDQTRWHLDSFWELVDEIMNAVLYVLIGLEVIAIQINPGYVIIALTTIVIVLLSRYLSVALSLAGMRLFRSLRKGLVGILTWSGLRGGISIALALSLPPGKEKDIILTITYVVVVFSILVQGLTIESFIKQRISKGSRVQNT